jgi:hypothetical protein
LAKRRFFFLVIFLFLILLFRRPQALIHPQLWAEDATVYFRDQLLSGTFRPVFMIHGGYVSVLQRLIALVSSLFPIAWIPFLYALPALAIDSGCFAVFYLDWFRHIISIDRLRLMFCLLIATAVYDNEVTGTLVNIQWPILLAGILLIFRRNAGQRFPVGWLSAGLLAGLTMPLLIVTAPFCLWRIWKKPRDAAYEAGLLLSVLAQLAIFLTRQHVPAVVGGGLVRLGVGCYVRALLVTLCGNQYALSHSSAAGFLAITLALALWWMLLWRRLAARERVIMAAAIYFGLASFLLSAVGRHLETYFADMRSLGGSRYMLLPGCALVFLVLLSVDKLLAKAPFRYQAVLLIGLFSVGIASNYRLPRLVDYPWTPYAPVLAERAREYREGRPVSPLQVPINPAPWVLRIP